MRTIKEIKKFRLMVSELKQAFDEVGFNVPTLIGALFILDWVLMPSDEKNKKIDGAR